MDETALVIFWKLALALGLGLLIGVERGWHQRDLPEGGRVAGVRTFGIIGLAGGMSGYLAERTDWTILLGALLAHAALTIFAYSRLVKTPPDIGSTTMFSMLATFVLGALCPLVDPKIPVAAAVVLTLLLGMKEQLHAGLTHLRQLELEAVAQLLLISAVVLPVLPDQGMGPWDAFNPYRTWLMVVLIASLSFGGYVAVRLTGPRLGPLLTGVFGGMVSSTAVAVSLSRPASLRGTDTHAVAAGVTIASSIMYLRMVVVVFVFDRPLAYELARGLAAAGLIGVVLAYLTMRSHRDATAPEHIPENPMALGIALRFGAFLAVISVLSVALRQWLGDAGLYILGMVSGLADVDPITLSLADQVGGGLSRTLAANVIILAAAMNTFVKIGIVAVNGGRRLGFMVGAPLLIALAIGAALFALPVGPWR